MNEKLKLIIGGSASTGSSLVAHIINNHSLLYCGSETNVFTKIKLLNSWQKHKHELSKKRFLRPFYSSSWHIHKGVQLSHLCSTKDLKRLISTSVNFESFIEKLFSLKCSSSSKKYFAEKTPSNAVLFQKFLILFPLTKLILTIRNPYDCIASMVNRGWSVEYAAGLYLFNISMGHIHSDRLLIIRYEDLVNDTSDEIKKLLEFVGLEYEDGLLSTIDSMVRLPSWMKTSHHIDDSISTYKTLSTFSRMDIKIQIKIVSAIELMKFKNDFEFYGRSPRYENIIDIIGAFDYDILMSTDESGHRLRSQFKNRLKFEKLKRCIGRYPLGFSNFPFELNPDKMNSPQ